MCSQPYQAQVDSVWRISLRQSALKSYESQARQLKSYYEASDIAMRSRQFNARKPLDSLLTDSLFMTAGIGLPLMTERLLDYRKSSNILGANYELISIATELNSKTDWNEFEKSLLKFAIAAATQLSNDKAAYILSSCSLRLAYADNFHQNDSLQRVITSLEKSIADQAASGASAMKDIRDKMSMWQLLTIVVSVAFLLLLIVFIAVRHSIIKKLRFELNKNLDTSELQILVRKNEDLKSESEQYKKTLEEVIRKMNSIDQTTRNYIGILEELKSMSLDSIELFRQHLEENKSKLSPEVYMALANSISRSASSLRDEYGKTIEQLS
jgi:uncharacterized protein YoxC